MMPRHYGLLLAALLLALSACTPHTSESIACESQFTSACERVLGNLDPGVYPLVVASLAGSGCRQNNRYACRVLEEKAWVVSPRRFAGAVLFSEIIPEMTGAGTDSDSVLITAEAPAAPAVPDFAPAWVKLGEEVSAEVMTANPQKIGLLLTTMIAAKETLTQDAKAAQIAAEKRIQAEQNIKNRILIQKVIVEPGEATFMRALAVGQTAGKIEARAAREVAAQKAAQQEKNEILIEKVVAAPKAEMPEAIEAVKPKTPAAPSAVVETPKPAVPKTFSAPSVRQKDSIPVFFPAGMTTKAVIRAVCAARFGATAGCGEDKPSVPKNKD